MSAVFKLQYIFLAKRLSVTKTSQILICLVNIKHQDALYRAFFRIILWNHNNNLRNVTFIAIINDQWRRTCVSPAVEEDVCAHAAADGEKWGAAWRTAMTKCGSALAKTSCERTHTHMQPEPRCTELQWSTCSRTDWGRSFIASYDKTIRRGRVWPECGEVRC